MKILIDIGHPAHVHYYRNLAKELKRKGHYIFWGVKDIRIARRLLDYHEFEYTVFPPKTDSLLGKLFMQLRYDWKLLKICKHEKINIAIGTSVSVAHVSRLSPVKSIVFDDDDDEVQPLITKYVNPFADSLLSPESLRGRRKRKNTIYYPGYHELAYLHPKRFTPDPGVLKEFNIELDDRIFIMRFNVFKAHHDLGIKGLSLEQKLKLIESLRSHGKIFITTERNIEPELEEFQLEISPEKIHSLMAYATLFVGDSQTMTSEAAVLGVPSLRCNSFAGQISYLEELEHTYGLTYAFIPSDFDKLLEKLNELLLRKNLKEEWQERRERMLEDKIDVTAFWTWFIDNYPGSVDMVMDESEFWEQFK